MVSIDPSVLETLASSAAAPPRGRRGGDRLLLQDRNVVSDVIDLLDVDDFYVVSNQIVFRAILDLFDHGSGATSRSSATTCSAAATSSGSAARSS